MQNQKDHVDAYAFLIARVTSALVVGDANYPEEPARRAWFGLLIGTGVAAFALAGFFVFGLITKHQAVPVPPVGSVGRPASPSVIALGVSPRLLVLTGGQEE